MAEVISAWRSSLRNSYTRFNGTIARPNARSRPNYSIDLDETDFNTSLPIDEILLESAKPSMEISQPRLRVILIPSPPPLPSRDMLLAATRQLHPHSRRMVTVTVDASTSDDSSASSVTPIDAAETAVGGLISCSVCMEEREPEYYPISSVTYTCWHPNTTCLRCLEYSIANDHSSKMWHDIRCPQCAAGLPYEKVKMFADETTFAHYDELMARQTLSKEQNFVWCTSCSAGQFHISSSDCPEVICNSCSATTCFNHRIPFHKGLTCAQYDRLFRHTALSALKSVFSSPPQSSSDSSSQKQDDGKALIEKIMGQKREARESRRGIRKDCKKCPGSGCGAMIYKIDGCKHMTCFNCSHEFCWRCKTDWFYGHKCWMFWRRN